MSSGQHYRFLNIVDGCFDKVGIENTFSRFLDRNKNNQWRDWARPCDIFDTAVVEWVGDLDCEIANIELFYTIPQCLERMFHIDMDPPRDFVKINFVWGSQDHIMQWGDPVDSRARPTAKTVVGTSYISYHDTEIAITESVKVEKPILVNVGKPHRVLNYSDQGRWCLCLIPRHRQTGDRILFDQALEVFKDYIDQ
jgi:hypothetical protein